MKNHTFGISLISVLGVICAGLSTDAMAAGSVRALGGTGTYNGTSAAATSTRTAPARAGSLRISPTSARLITTTNNNTSSAATGSTSTGTTQRLSVGKYLGAASQSSTGSSAGSTTNNLTTRIEQLEGSVERLEQDRPFISSGDDIVQVDQDNGEVSIDTAALLAALDIESGTDGREVELNYDEGTKILGWRYTGETDYTPLVNIGALVGDYASAQDLEDAILSLNGKQPKSTAAYSLGNADGGWTQMTEAELAALQSGITSTDVAQINTNKSDIATLSGTLGELTGIEGIESGLVTNDDLTEALAGKQDTLTAPQLAAVNSNVTSTTVQQVAANANAIALQDQMIAGKQAAITAQNPLSADLVDDSASTNKFVTADEKSTWNAKQDALTFDNTPTANSTNPVTSGGIYTAINAISGDVAAIDDQIDAALADYTTTADLQTSLNAKADKTGVYPKTVAVPTTGQYVLGFVDGVQMYIPIVDGDGNSGAPVVAEVTEEPQL